MPACRILQDVEDANILTYLVTWETQEDLEEHLRSDRFRRLLPYIEMSREPPEVEFSTHRPGPRNRIHGGGAQFKSPLANIGTSRKFKPLAHLVRRII